MIPNYNYPYQMQPVQQQPRPQNYGPAIKGRPVSSFEEARASMIDFDGSIFYFPDTANQKIYTKQINLDGTPSIKIYELIEPEPPAPQEELVTKKEFNEVINNLLQQIKATSTSVPEDNVKSGFSF